MPSLGVSPSSRSGALFPYPLLRPVLEVGKLWQSLVDGHGLLERPSNKATFTRLRQVLAADKLAVRVSGARGQSGAARKSSRARLVKLQGVSRSSQEISEFARCVVLVGHRQVKEVVVGPGGNGTW